MSARNILVTGATSGLGYAVVNELCARGHRVRATGRSVSAGQALVTLGAEFVPADLAAPDDCTAALVEGVDSIVHAAALSASWGPRANFERTNVEATQRLLASATKAEAGRFVFISSPSIFAAYKDRVLIGQDAAPGSCLNDYSRTKLHAERLVLASATGAMARCVIRPRALVGPGDRVILPRLINLARRPRMPLPRGGRALIELTDLRDAARAICDAEDRTERINGAAINISGGRPVTVRNLALALAAALDRCPKLIDLPFAVAYPFAAALEISAKAMRSDAEPVLTRYTLATLAFSQTFDLSPARNLLDYTPQHDATATLLNEARRFIAMEQGL